MSPLFQRKRSDWFLCIITHGYPCKENPTWFPFTKQFAHAAARSGVKVVVIAPLPIHLAGKYSAAEHETETMTDGSMVEVFRPRYLSASSIRIGKWNTAQIGLLSFCSAVRRILKLKNAMRPGAFYGHFLYMGGAAAVRMGEEMGIPAFPMVGDGMLNSMDPFGAKRARRHLEKASGFMANSSCLARLLQSDLGISPARIGIFPNGVDHQNFYPRDKVAMRQKLKLPQDRMLVICAGKQDLQKGPVRVGAAINGMQGVGGIFLGAGSNPPCADNIVFNQSVPHDQVPEWLSAADVFVLPSTFEGCCNAMVEAMACGLPVIGAKGDFNDDILNEEVSIRVDPLDILEIQGAITSLRNDPERRTRMGRAARQWSLNFDVEKRAQRMMTFMMNGGHVAEGLAGKYAACDV